MKIDIDPSLIPDGWRALRAGVPQPGDSYAGLNTIGLCTSERPVDGIRIIVGPCPKWPTLFKSRCMAMDDNGDWYSYQDEIPIFDEDTLLWKHDGNDRDIMLVDPNHFDFEFPKCEAAESLWLNPNW